MAKIRTGFVSNSSSTSFLVSAKGENRPILKLEIDLTNYARYTIKTYADAITYFKEEWEEDFWTQIGEKNDRALWMLNQLKEGKTVYYGWAYNDGDGWEDLALYYLAENLYQQEID